MVTNITKGGTTNARSWWNEPAGDLIRIIFMMINYWLENLKKHPANGEEQFGKFQPQVLRINVLWVCVMEKKNSNGEHVRSAFLCKAVMMKLFWYTCINKCLTYKEWLEILDSLNGKVVLSCCLYVILVYFMSEGIVVQMR